MNLPINLSIKPQTIFIIILIFIIGVLLMTRGCNPQPSMVHTIDYKKTLDSLKQVTNTYNAALAAYQQKNDSLTKQLASTEVQLQQQKAKLSPIQKKVKKVIREDWNKLPKEEKLEKCDSLKELVTEYEAQLVKKDSLTEEKINGLTQVIDIKDEQLQLCQESFNDVNKMLEESIQDNKTCSTDLKKMERKLKRKQFFNRVFGSTAVVAVITVAAIVVVAL